MNKNVSWFFVPKRHLADYLAGRNRMQFPHTERYVTGRNTGKTYAPNGKHEVARRLRQMGGANVQS